MAGRLTTLIDLYNWHSPLFENSIVTLLSLLRAPPQSTLGRDVKIQCCLSLPSNNAWSQNAYPFLRDWRGIFRGVKYHKLHHLLIAPPACYQSEIFRIIFLSPARLAFIFPCAHCKTGWRFVICSAAGCWLTQYFQPAPLHNALAFFTGLVNDVVQW